MKKKLSLLLIIVLIFTSTIGFAQSSLDLAYIESLTQFIQAHYLYDIEEGKLTEGALKGIFSSLDPYSAYYTAEEYERLTENLTGEISAAGIGVKIMEKDKNIVIMEVIKGNPAAKSGLKVGDTIVSVDDIDVVGLSIENTSNLIRGQAGTKVKIEVKRPASPKPLIFSVERKPIVFNPVEWKTLEKGIGLIKISEFNNHATSEVRDALNHFKKENINKVVFDLRDNPGGYLSSVIDILRLVCPEGPLVHVKDVRKKTITYNSYTKTAGYKLMVLVNENSASASEIFAGAVQDKKIGKVVGTKTFGKGTVQDIIPLENGGAMKLTVAEYFTPNMKKVNKLGISPDIVGNGIYNKEETDLDLKTAIKELKK